MTVLVVGAGITGLSAAHELAAAGIATLLVEASERLGGKVRTERADGFLVEAGPDSFISYRPAAIELCRELGLGEALIRPSEPRTVQVRTGGRFVPLPEGIGLLLPTRLRPFVTSPMFSPLEKLRIGLDLVLPRARDEGDVAVGPFLRRRLGGPLVERLAGPLIGGVYGTPIDQLSLDAVVPQLRAAERDHRSLILAGLAQGRARASAGSVGGGIGGAAGGRAGANSTGANGTGSPFVTLAGGTGQLVEALAGSLGRSSSVTLRTRTRVTGLERRGGRSIVRLESADRSGEWIEPEAVILAAPAPVAADLLDGIAPATAAQLRAIPHGSSGVVSLAYRLEQFARPPAGHGFLVAETEPLTISACTLSSLKWAGRAPEGTVLLRAFIGSNGSEQERLLGAPDELLVAAARRDLAATLGVRGEPILSRVTRLPGAMPHYTVGHLERVAAAVAGLAGTPDLVLAGAAYRGVGIPDCIAQGRAAARRVVQGRAET